jgi:hypothetical protein
MLGYVCRSRLMKFLERKLPGQEYSIKVCANLLATDFKLLIDLFGQYMYGRYIINSPQPLEHVRKTN